MSRLTTDPDDDCIQRGPPDKTPVPQNSCYLVLTDEELAKGFVRPVRDAYVHVPALGGCGALTTMGRKLAETYARDPHFYGSTYCVGCSMHRPVGAGGEFHWDGTTELVGA